MRRNFPTMAAHVLLVVVLFTCATSFATAVENARSKDEETTEFNAVLATLVQQGLDHLAEYKPVKRVIKSLRKELKSEDVQTEQKQKKNVQGDKVDWSGAVNDIMDSVDTFFGDKKESLDRVRAKETAEVADIFAEFQMFRMDLKRFRVDYWRIGRMLSLTLELMSRRPKLRNNVAEGITQLFSLPKSVNLEEPLNMISQTMAMWNTPMGQKLVKPMLDKMMKNFQNSNYDVNVIKPSVEILLTSVLGANSQGQLKPAVDVVFTVVDRLIKMLQASGFGNLIKNVDPTRTLRMAQDAYVEVFLDMIEPLHDVVKKSDRVSEGLENVMDVTRRYRNIPGTMDVRFRRGDFNDPVAKVKSILTQLERAKSEIDESRDAIAGMHAYPLHHPLQAIDAIKLLLVTLNDGQQALQDFWPLRGFLRTHPIVKGYDDLDRDVGELKEMATRAIDKTHKIQILIDDVKNLESIFDIKTIYVDIRNILVGFPKMGILVTVLDLVYGELDQIKEIAYNGI